MRSAFAPIAVKGILILWYRLQFLKPAKVMCDFHQWGEETVNEPLPMQLTTELEGFQKYKT